MCGDCCACFFVADVIVVSGKQATGFHFVQVGTYMALPISVLCEAPFVFHKIPLRRKLLQVLLTIP